MVHRGVTSDALAGSAFTARVNVALSIPVVVVLILADVVKAVVIIIVMVVVVVIIVVVVTVVIVGVIDVVEFCGYVVVVKGLGPWV